MRDLNREDLIVLGLEWSINDAELRRYFEQFGEVAEAEVSSAVCVYLYDQYCYIKETLHIFDACK